MTLRYGFIKKKKRLKNAPFDLMLAVQESRLHLWVLLVFRENSPFWIVIFSKSKEWKILANCHVKWSAQKGIGEVRGGLCQTDGTPCCVFDWKRKVTFAAASKRQWSAKQIGLRSPPSPEQTRRRVQARLYFKIMLCVRLSWCGRGPLSRQHREGEVFVEVAAALSAQIAAEPGSARAWCLRSPPSARRQRAGRPGSFLSVVGSPCVSLRGAQGSNCHAAHKKATKNHITRANHPASPQRHNRRRREMTRKTLLALEFSSNIQTSPMAKRASVCGLSACAGGGRVWAFFLVFFFFFSSSQLAALFRFSKDKVQKCPLGDIQNSI